MGGTQTKYALDLLKNHSLPKCCNALNAYKRQMLQLIKKIDRPPQDIIYRIVLFHFQGVYMPVIFTSCTSFSEQEQNICFDLFNAQDQEVNM